VATTCVRAAARVAAAEFSGVDCSGLGEDGTSVSVADNQGDIDLGQAYNLSPAITLAAGSLLFGMIHSSSGANYSGSGSTISIPTAGTEINTVALGGYLIAGAGAAYDLPFVSDDNENSHLMAAGIKASAGAVNPCTRSLLGVGCL
jgi:hypothetical protein